MRRKIKNFGYLAFVFLLLVIGPVSGWAVPGIKITQPANGTAVTPGQNITVTVDAVEGFVCVDGMIVANDFFAKQISVLPANFNLTIPKGDYPFMEIMAVAKDQSNNFVSDKVDLVYQHGATLQAIQVTPESWYFETDWNGNPIPGDVRSLAVKGLYDDGVGRDLTTSGSVFSSSNPAVALVDANGKVQAVSVGTATITITNSGYGFQVPITVSKPEGPARSETIPPTTTMSVQPAVGSDGWYPSDVSVTLTATDNPDGSGAGTMTYVLDKNEPQTIENSIVQLAVSGEGKHRLIFAATDKDHNEELTQYVDINIRKAYELHLTNVAGYYSDGSTAGSAGATAQAILSFLNPAGPGNIATLVLAADTNKDGLISPEELTNFLNSQASGEYNFGSSKTLQNYSQAGYIGQFDAANQDDVIKQVCHWLAYQVPGAQTGKANVPVAVCTSANPALNADSDYSHWMSVVGIKTLGDPFPALAADHSYADYYKVPDYLELVGMYVNDPAVTGLGFHSYVAGDTFKSKYFRPIMTGLQDAGLYMAVMEPPDKPVIKVKTVAAQNNDGLQYVLGTPQNGVSVFIPGRVNPEVKKYLAGMFDNLQKSTDFAAVLSDKTFNRSFADTQINRCYKVGSPLAEYTIIPFEKQTKTKDLATTAALIINNKTGQLQIATINPDADTLYQPMSWFKAYKLLRKEIGWGKQYPLSYWLYSGQGNPLYPGWNAAIASYTQQGPVLIVRTGEYAIPAGRNSVELTAKSPKVDVIYRKAYRLRNETGKMVLLKVSETKKYSFSQDNRQNCTTAAAKKYGDMILVVLTGNKDAACRLSIRDHDNDSLVTYVYVR